MSLHVLSLSALPDLLDKSLKEEHLPRNVSERDGSQKEANVHKLLAHSEVGDIRLQELFGITYLQLLDQVRKAWEFMHTVGRLPILAIPFLYAFQNTTYRVLPLPSIK
jgi:HD superfamily phosphohydrolase YqeK